jgi:hypothetical protein
MTVPYEERSCATCKHKVEQVVAVSPFVDLTRPYCTYFGKSYTHPVKGYVIENLECGYAMEKWCQRAAYSPTFWGRVKRFVANLGVKS